MQRHLIHLFSVVLAAATSSSIVAQEESVYIAVDPCRIVNTTKGLAQPVPKNRHTNFRVSGTAGELADQGGNQSGGCAAPQGREGEVPIAIAAYVIAVPAPGAKAGGVLTAYPSDKPSPPPGTGSTVNFDAGQTIGNTTIITLCQPENCPADGEFAILARNTAEHVIVDVQGYFYPPSSLPGYQVLQAPFAAANRTSVVAEVRCPSGTRVLSGGGSLGNSDWVLDGSYPRTDGQGWRVSYKTAGNTFSVAGQVWAVCANGS
jgi:hypothetical protein